MQLTTTQKNISPATNNNSKIKTHKSSEISETYDRLKLPKIHLTKLQKHHTFKTPQSAHNYKLPKLHLTKLREHHKSPKHYKPPKHSISGNNKILKYSSQTIFFYVFMYFKHNLQN